MNIFVGNLAFTATDDEVRQLFEGYGDRGDRQLLMDRDTGRPRGFGFVEMPNATQARAAIAGLNGKDLGGRPLTINEARPREERVGHVVSLGGKRHACTTATPWRPWPASAPTTSPLPGYLCEQCQDAPAVQWQPVPEGGERGVCAACGAGRHDDEPHGHPDDW